SIVRINGSARSSTFIDAFHMLVQVSPNDAYNSGTDGGFFITVFNGGTCGGYSNASFLTVNNLPPANSGTNGSGGYTSSTNNYNTSNYSNTTTNTSEGGSNLASSVILGSNSILPSGIIQWILFGILILIIIILVRKIFGARERYDEAPLKHA
ncbi:MAG: hypothetical protein ACREGC_03725, partial [Minisyncoccia bacterium]